MDATGNEVQYTALAKDVAAKYGVSRAHVYNLVERGEIPHRKIGNAIRFNLDEVDEWMRAQSVAAAESKAS